MGWHTAVERLGKGTLDLLVELGALARLSHRTLLSLPRMHRRELGRAFVQYGYDSLPLTLIVATLVGATVVLQTRLYVQRLGVRTLFGWAAGYAVLWEFGPLLLGLVMAARVGARNCAELALLKVGGQLEGLRAISLDPYPLLVAPRVVATSLSVFLLGGVTFGVAIAWEALAARVLMGLPFQVFLGSFAEVLDLGDLAAGLAKAGAFGVAIALLSTLAGLRAQAGARGVGRAAASAVVLSSGAIFALDFALTPLLTAIAG